MIFKVSWVTIVLLLAGGSGASGASGARIAAIDRMLSTLGGEAKIDALTSLAVEAECLGPRDRFKTWVRSRRPGSVNFRQSSPDGETEIWSTPSETWRLDENAAIQPLEAPVRAFVRGHEFHLLLFEIYHRLENHRVRDIEIVDDSRCLAISMVDEGGNPASLCIDTTTHLPVALELRPDGSSGPITILFEQWTWVDGLRYFWSFTLIEGTTAFRYDYIRIEPNAVPADLFVRPTPAAD